MFSFTGHKGIKYFQSLSCDLQDTPAKLYTNEIRFKIQENVFHNHNFRLSLRLGMRSSAMLRTVDW